jgi:hypothetical protein
MRALGFALLVGACTTEGVETRTLAELGPVTLEMFVGRSVMDVSVKYRPAEAPECAVLGADFGANVSGLAASVWPGGMQGYCTGPTNGQPCAAYEACDMPFAGFHDWPLIEDAVLEIGDASRTIRCDLKDALVPRRLVRVDQETWDVVRGERVTVRWEPHHDIGPGFEPRVWMVDANGNQWYVDWRMDGELISFVVPPVESGMHEIWIAGGQEIENANGCEGVPNRQLRSYHADQLLNVK